MPLLFVRAFLFLLGVLALLTATVLDGITLRFMNTMLRLMEQRSGRAPLAYPAPMRFLLAHAWARRLYHLLVAVLIFALWWYLGTPAGAAAFMRAR